MKLRWGVWGHPEHLKHEAVTVSLHFLNFNHGTHLIKKKRKKQKTKTTTPKTNTGPIYPRRLNLIWSNNMDPPQRRPLLPSSAPSYQRPSVLQRCDHWWWRSCQRRCQGSWTRVQAPGRWTVTSCRGEGPQSTPGWGSSSASRRPENTKGRRWGEPPKDSTPSI